MENVFIVCKDLRRYVPINCKISDC